MILSTRYSNKGINTISHVEIFKAQITIKNNDKKIYHVRLDYNETTSAWQTLHFFLLDVLPFINNKFVLLITGEDITIPNQVDPRWTELKHIHLIKNVYNAVITNPFLIHCYIENRDEIHEKTSSIPLGLNPREFPDHNIDYILKYMTHYPPLFNRELKVICVHRDRAGDREVINKLKVSAWKDYVIVNTCKHDEWYKLLQTYPFIICAHGGGIDPCPKVWEALCVGCIPIIKHSAMDDVYKEFPIIFVDSWEENTITYDKLITWKNKYSKYYDIELRKQWIHKLYLEYWKNKIEKHIDIYS
jgi:hypothetical protein